MGQWFRYRTTAHTQGHTRPAATHPKAMELDLDEEKRLNGSVKLVKKKDKIKENS